MNFKQILSQNSIKRKSNDMSEDSDSDSTQIYEFLDQIIDGNRSAAQQCLESIIITIESNSDELKNEIIVFNQNSSVDHKCDSKSNIGDIGLNEEIWDDLDSDDLYDMSTLDVISFQNQSSGLNSGSYETDFKERFQNLLNQMSETPLKVSSGPIDCSSLGLRVISELDSIK